MKLDTVQIGDEYFHVQSADIYDNEVGGSFSANVVIDISTNKKYAGLDKIEKFEELLMSEKKKYVYIIALSIVEKMEVDTIEPVAFSGVWYRCFINSGERTIVDNYKNRYENFNVPS